MNKQNAIDFIDDLLADYSLYFDMLCQEDVAQNVIKAIENSSKGDN